MSWQQSSATQVRTGALLARAIGKGVQAPRTTYDPAKAADILRHVMEDGAYLSDAIEAEGMAKGTLYQWRAAQPELAEAIQIARAIGADTLLAKAVKRLEAAQDQVDVNRADKLLRNAQWYAERMASADYADIASRGTSKVADSLASLLEAMTRAEASIDITPSVGNNVGNDDDDADEP